MIGIVLAVAVASSSAVRTAPTLRCGTPELLGAGPVYRKPPPAIRAFAVTKSERDAFGGLTTVVTSENFALKWGSGVSVSSTKAQQILGYFEHAWSVELGEMGYPAPEHSDTRLFNVYIGDSGNGAPTIDGAAAYFWYDSDGYPMIVVNPSELNSPELDETAAHEFFHAVQGATGSFFDGISDEGMWFWEATATWIMPYVISGGEGHAMFLAGMAAFPHLPIGYYNSSVTNWSAYHQYGAFIFPQYLTELVADVTLIRDVWLGAGSEQDPLRVLDEELAARGESLTYVFGRFAAHNATWDYAEGELYSDALDYVLDFYPDEDHQLIAEHRTDSGGWVTASGLLPRGFGYNVVKLTAPEAPYLRFEVAADAAGTYGTPAHYEVTVVAQAPDHVTYHPVGLDADEYGELTLELGDETVYYLVVAAPVFDARSSETFGYSYAIGAGSASSGNNDDDEDRGCNAAAPGMLGALVALVFMTRMRRR
jgi:hypothetical protein